MDIRQLASVAAFAFVLTSALSTRADVAPPCEACILHNEGDPCTVIATGKPGKCVNDGNTCLQCVETVADAGTGGGSSGSSSSGGSKETGGGCSAAGAVGTAWAAWAIAALPLLMRRRRARR